MSFMGTYKARQFNLSGLKGISDQTLEMHFKLYEGYVKETNKLTEKIAEFLKDGKVDQEEMPLYSELKRRLGFERSEEHTSELQSPCNLVCRLLLEKKKENKEELYEIKEK